MPPSADSINELLDVVRIDSVVDDTIGLAKRRIIGRLQSFKETGNRSPAQQAVADEYARQLLTTTDDELNRDRFRENFFIVIQQSFSQQDIDSATAFYRSRSGRQVSADMRSGMHAFVEQRLEGGEHPPNDGLPASFNSFFKPWNNPDYASFFASDVGQDIKARWPAASQRLDEATDDILAELRRRLSVLATEYREKMHAATAK